jgi:hypothetical protein
MEQYGRVWNSSQEYGRVILGMTLSSQLATEVNQNRLDITKFHDIPLYLIFMGGINHP